jgi:hypothetical protein
LPVDESGSKDTVTTAMVVICRHQEYEAGDRCPDPGSVAKNGWGRKKLGPDSSLGGNLEEALHESHLSANVAFPDSFNLSFPNHVVG